MCLWKIFPNFSQCKFGWESDNCLTAIFQFAAQKPICIMLFGYTRDQ